MRTVLIVEDSEVFAETLREALDSMPNVQVLAISDPLRAAAVITDTSNELAALVTDLHLGARSGLEMIRTLRNRNGGDQVPAILISGDADASLPARAHDLGAEFLSKPFSPAAMRRKLEDLICDRTSR